MKKRIAILAATMLVIASYAASVCWKSDYPNQQNCANIGDTGTVSGATCNNQPISGVCTAAVNYAAIASTAHGVGKVSNNTCHCACDYSCGAEHKSGTCTLNKTYDLLNTLKCDVY